MRKLALPLLLLFFFNAAGQTLDSAARKPNSEADSTINLYFTTVGQTSAIYNGRIFYWYPLMQGHAFYSTSKWQPGSVLYDGTWYHSLSMMYDIFKDEVILKHPDSAPIRLISDRVQEFHLSDQHFIRIRPVTGNGLKNTFYQSLEEGKVSLYATRHKRIEESIVDNTLIRTFIPVDGYYLLKEGKYYEVTSQKQLYSLLKEHKQGMSQHLRQQKLKFKKDRENTIIQMVKYYNQSYK